MQHVLYTVCVHVCDLDSGNNVFHLFIPDPFLGGFELFHWLVCLMTPLLSTRPPLSTWVPFPL